MTTTVETIVTAYVEAAEGDVEKALIQVVEDALANLLEAERRTHRAERLISKGYARGQITTAQTEPHLTAHQPQGR